MLDCIILDGQYPDWRKKKMMRKNIGIQDGKIAYVGLQEPPAAKVIEATGKVVSPGFIDIHMHEEDFAAEGHHFDISLRMLQMGVTTGLGGNCGHGRQPLSYFKNVLLEEMGGAPINYMMLAGYNNLRSRLGVGHYEVTTNAQRQQLRAELQKELTEGACGISFGIEYDPAMTYDEMLDAVAILGDTEDYLVAEHYRTDDTKNNDAVREMVRFAAEIPQKFQISHISSCSAFGNMQEELEWINAGMEKNPQLNFDTYPYAAFSCSIGSAVFDEGCFESWGKGYDSILLTGEPYKNVRCTKEIFEDARKNHPTMLAVVFAMDEDDIRKAIINPKGMIGSDGLIRNGSGHPRAAGTFPRVLGKYVREEQALSLFDALRKMTLEPALRLGLDKKGRIEEGCDADLTIFDPRTIIDKATFTELESPDGIDQVLIRGKTALWHGEILDDRAGEFIPYKDR